MEVSEGSSERVLARASEWRLGMKWYDRSWTSFMHCFHTNQRKEPRAHSLFPQVLLRAWWSGVLLVGRQSREQKARRGYQKGDSHNHGLAERLGL